MNQFSRDLRVLIFAHPRSGSNTLTTILNEHPDIHLMFEPFNESREKWAGGHKNYKNTTHTIEDLERALEEIHQEHNGFKTLSYQLPEPLNEHLLTKKGYTIVFLHRRNLLKSVVSGAIADQTQIWTAEEKEARKGAPVKIAPLDVNKLREKLDHFKEDVTHYLSFLKNSQAAFLEITYEALFEAQDDEKHAELEKVFVFLGLEIPPDKREAMESLLSPQRRITDVGTYNLVPNIEEVEDTLGRDETGYLFI